MYPTPLNECVTEVTGINKNEIRSRSRNSGAMVARHILVGTCREIGYKLVDLQSELRRDLSVLSRWCSASEGEERRRIVQKVLKQLIA
ncbi:MAG: hypothetical protein C0415_01605 [Thermodesulfovibrio sp.]|nr:hypothetical protein [Thermodesulfovibrio sp.]